MSYSFDSDSYIDDVKLMWDDFHLLQKDHGRVYVEKYLEITEKYGEVHAFTEAVVDVYKDMFSCPDAHAPFAYLTNYGHYKGCYSDYVFKEEERSKESGSIVTNIPPPIVEEMSDHKLGGDCAVFASIKNNSHENLWVLAHEYGHWADYRLMRKNYTPLEENTGDRVLDGLAQFLNEFRDEMPGQILGIHALNVLSKKNPHIGSMVYDQVLPEIKEAWEKSDEYFKCEFGFSAIEMVKDPAKMLDFVEQAVEHIEQSSFVFKNYFKIFESAKPEYKAFYDNLINSCNELREDGHLTADAIKRQKYYSRSELLAQAAALIRKEDFFEVPLEEHHWWGKSVKEKGEKAVKEDIIKYLGHYLESDNKYNRERNFKRAISIIEFLMPENYILPQRDIEKMDEEFTTRDCFDLVGAIYARNE